MFRNTHWKKQALLVLGLCALVAVLAPAHAADHRLRVEVNEPFEINGWISDSDVVVLREVARYNPNETLHEIWVGNTSLGLVVARSVESEGVADNHALLFQRNAAGHLVLVAVTFRGEQPMTLHAIPEHAMLAHQEAGMLSQSR
jgi:hypothetical protein